MMTRNILIFVLIIILVISYSFKIHENYFSSSYDITPQITANMDWKGATLSKLPYYTNNLVNPPEEVLKNIQELQKYQPKSDNTTNTTYVSDDMILSKNLNNPNNRQGLDGLERLEGFSMMNPYIPN
jgi:hypothetical protein